MTAAMTTAAMAASNHGIPRRSRRCGFSSAAFVEPASSTTFLRAKISRSGHRRTSDVNDVNVNDGTSSAAFIVRCGAAADKDKYNSQAKEDDARQYGVWGVDGIRQRSASFAAMEEDEKKNLKNLWIEFEGVSAAAFAAASITATGKKGKKGKKKKKK